MHKQIHVFHYMPTAPKVFSVVDKQIALTGVLEISTDMSESHLRGEISELIHSKGGIFSSCGSQDFEFIRVSQKSAQVPATKPGFEWNGSAVKGLAAQGSLYVRLIKAFKEPSTSEPRSSRAEYSDDDFEVPRKAAPKEGEVRKHTSSLAGSQPSICLQAHASTLGVDTRNPTSPIAIPSSDDSSDDEEQTLPAFPFLTCKHPVLSTSNEKPTTEKITLLSDMFPDATITSILSLKCVGMIYNLQPNAYFHRHHLKPS